jgi:hypothetical protein
VANPWPAHPHASTTTGYSSYQATGQADHPYPGELYQPQWDPAVYSSAASGGTSYYNAPAAYLQAGTELAGSWSGCVPTRTSNTAEQGGMGHTTPPYSQCAYGSQEEADEMMAALCGR